MYRLILFLLINFVSTPIFSQVVSNSVGDGQIRCVSKLKELKDTLAVIHQYAKLVKYNGKLDFKEIAGDYIILEDKKLKKNHNVFFIKMSNDSTIDIETTLIISKQLKKETGFITKERAEQILLKNKLIPYLIKDYKKGIGKELNMYVAYAEISINIFNLKLNIPYWYYECWSLVNRNRVFNNAPSKESGLIQRTFYINAKDGSIIIGDISENVSEPVH